MNLQKGERFDHYLILAHIAQGGIGDVYHAADLETGHDVALKIPLRFVMLDPVRYEQFLREQEALQILHHPAIQRWIQSGRYQNTPYLVTGWVEGKSLRKLLKSGPFSVDRAIVLTGKIAQGLAYCHEQGVVHRDIKPDNILISNDGQPFILDFGLALTPIRPLLAKAVGTPGYASPEQIEGQSGDKRVDIYGLGATLYEMLAGEALFASQESWEIMEKQLSEAVPRLDRVRPGVSRQLATVVARCLQRDADARYPDMSRLLIDLNTLELVDTSVLEILTTRPPKPTFFKRQAGQVVLLLTATIAGIALLTLIAVALKH